MKFGGTSVADAERIQRAAQRIVQSAENGNSVVSVLSARGKHTDELVSLAHEVSPRPHPREMDMLLSTGERVTCALAAMVINDLGHEAISLTGSQAGIVTDSGHTKARIIEVRAHRIRAALDEGKIVLVAGFQGVSQESLDVTTLGRGGSDTTAVALAAALGAPVCEIYTDVAGVFSADPRIVPDARKLPVLTFEEMLEMSASGAGVLQLRSVEYARNHGVTIHCRASFDDGPGTVVQDEDMTMERPLVTAVTHSTAEARVTVTGLPDVPGIAGRVLSALAEANINVDMIIQNEGRSDDHRADMSFTVPRDDLELARTIARQAETGRQLRGHRDRRAHGEGVRGRGGNEEPPRRGGQDIHRSGRGRGEHRDDLDLSDQDLLRRPRGARGDRRQAAPHRLRTGRGRRAPRGRRRRPPSEGGLVLMRVAVVGATGAVGSTMLGVLRERSFPAEEVVPFASERSAGRKIDWGDSQLTCVPLGDETIQGFDIALFSAGSGVSAEWAPRFADAGAVVVDNSSQWRMHEDVPLVVSEVNPEALDSHSGIVANPNCTTMQTVVALGPILRQAGIERVVMSSYQAVSGTGQRAVEELHDQAGAVIEARELPPPSVYPHQIAFNVLPQVETFKDGDDYTTEERKCMAETRKILGRDDVGVSATCARVPVFTGHSVSAQRADARAAVTR